METPNNETANVEVQHSPQKPNISFDDFQKLDIRICKIITVEKVPNTDKLYKMQIDTGLDKRTVVSAIADKVEAGALIENFFPFVLNLVPRKIKGIESTAMIIMASQKEELISLFPIPINVDINDISDEELEKYLIGSIVI